MIYLLLVFIVLFLMRDARSKSPEVDGSKHFHISNGASKQIYIKMNANGASNEFLKNFVQMEDRFLEYEKKSVCSGISHLGQASLLSNKIKEIFHNYDFSYHTIHLKQIAEPNKSINDKITC